MNATAHLTNRMAGYFLDEKNEEKFAAPDTAEARDAFWLETLHLAMVELRAELKSENLKVRSKAAHKIIDLERTKLRHAKKSSLAGRAGDGASFARSASDGASLAGRASDGNSEDPSLANKMAEIEAGAIDMLALDIQTMTAKFAEKLQLKDRSMTTPGAARTIIARYMEANDVTALKIDPQEMALVVMNMMADYKEHEEAVSMVTDDREPTANPREFDSAIGFDSLRMGVCSTPQVSSALAG